MTETGETPSKQPSEPPSEQPKFSRRGFLRKTAEVGGALAAGGVVGALGKEALGGEPQINLAELPAALLQSFNKDQRGTGAEKGGIGEALKAANNVAMGTMEVKVGFAPAREADRPPSLTFSNTYNLDVDNWPLDNIRVNFAQIEQEEQRKLIPTAIEQNLGTEPNQSVRFTSEDSFVWNVRHGLEDEGDRKLRAELEKAGFTVQADPENPQDWSLDVSKGNRVQRYHGVMPVGLFDNANNLSKIGIVGYNTGIQQYEHIPSASF